MLKRDSLIFKDISDMNSCFAVYLTSNKIMLQVQMVLLLMDEQKTHTKRCKRVFLDPMTLVVFWCNGIILISTNHGALKNGALIRLDAIG